MSGTAFDEAECPPWDPLGEPVWNPLLAVQIIGKRILVGGAGPGSGRLYGVAIRADQRGGIALRLGGARAGEEIVLPPDTRPFRRAAPGAYRLCGSGEVVTDPDYLTC